MTLDFIYLFFDTNKEHPLLQEKPKHMTLDHSLQFGTTCNRIFWE
jgi:hypothetical protein